ncbi:helix-turn-helix domain-containing protein [Bradyrhizobium elkanii]|uniref:helix-turn-helix domain-containing protein n=1 Tax=Bradyrhizobium elkanii TaxID=29448 RepID=UPI0035187861
MLTVITGRECKAARQGLDMTREQLAAVSNVHKRTILDFENGSRSPIPATRQALRMALEAAGAIFEDGRVCIPVPADETMSA